MANIAAIGLVHARPGRWLLLGLFLLFLCVPLSASESIRVKGLGWFQSRALTQQIAFLRGDTIGEERLLDAAIIEDSAFLLLAQLQRLGYFNPRFEARWVQLGEPHSAEWESPYQPAISMEVMTDSVTFHIDAGPLAFYDHVEVHGLEVLDSQRALRMIVPDNALIRTRRARVFTNDNLENRIDRILDELDRRGHRQARLLEESVEMDAESGAVDVVLRFEEGPVFRVGRVEMVDGDEVETDLSHVDGEVIHTREWEREQRQLLLNQAWRKGYADARVRVSIIESTPLEDGVVYRDLRFTLLRGEHITLESVKFESEDPVRGSVLRRQSALRAGEPLDIVAVSDARRRLMALGVFRSVDLRYEEGETADARRVYFDLQPGTRQEVSLLGGWGSYEMARGGILWQRNNLWHRAHRLDVDTRVSMKARSLSGRYTIPQLFGTDLTGYTRSRYVYREELSFDRELIGASVGTRFVIPRSDWSASVEYTIERQDTLRRGSGGFQTKERATVAGINTRLVLDLRDDVIYPERGLMLSVGSLLSASYLGADVNFQKTELAAAYHYPLGDSRVLHTGLRLGHILSFGDASNNVPFNERFFPGGDQSIRGYRQGEASPLDANGQQIGAESYLLANLELQQRVIGRTYVVLFWDSLATTVEANQTGSASFLHSSGLGLRYRTPLGPVRLEYGRNLNPRPTDPQGTLLFSIGFPF
jgi:outer membrane protein insertion porin family